MEFLVDGQLSAEAPTEEFISRWFATPHDPSEFLVLRDPRHGEVRATAPVDGTTLVQAELRLPGRSFSGEATIPSDVACGWLASFTRGDLDWHTALGASGGTAWFRPAALLAAVGFALLMASRLTSGCS